MTWRSVFVSNLFFVAGLCAQPASPMTDLTGSWVDSQGNRFTLVERSNAAAGRNAGSRGGSHLALECPRCEFLVGDRSYDGTLSMDLAATNDGALEGRDPRTGTSAIIRGPQLPSGMLRLSLRLGSEASSELVMARPPQAQVSRTRPAGVALDLRQASTVIGKWVPMLVYLTDRQGRMTTPTSSTLVQLQVRGGTPVPSVVRVSPESPAVPAGVVMSTAQAALTASAAGFTPALAAATGCEQIPAAELRLKISAPRDQALANGRDAIPIVFSLVDANDTPATDGKPKQFGFEVAGVGRLADLGASAVPASIITAGQCADQRRIVSDTPGSSKVSAEFRGRTLTRSLSFKPILSWLAISLALAGGGIGGFVSAARNYSAVRRWKARRWVYWFLSACAGGIALYLAYFYGLLRQMATAPNAAGFAFLAGLIGGFLGAAALEVVQKTITGDAGPKSAAAVQR